ncbi:MAG: periplasmic heavy metal sensor [Candidatus Obscuribacterales bacterium]|nr:periplasmic heavy metal sensor [Candidatus Obscuribacterales bacterium]
MKAAIATGLITCLTLTLSPAFAQDAFEDSSNDNSISVLPLDTASANPLGGRGAFKGNQLELTSEQQEKAYNMKNKLMDQVEPKKTEMKKLKRELKDLLTKESIDRSAVEATQAKINSLHTDLANTTLAFKMDFNEMLTADQRQKLRFRQGRKGGGHKQHRGMRRGQIEKPSTIGSQKGTELDVASQSL